MRKFPGFTLIEIVVTIVVISIAATALLSVFSTMIRGSADPMLQQQATTIAEAYMEEIVLKAFADPQGGETGNDEGELTDRSIYDDVQDYNSLGTTQVRRQDNTAIVASSQYAVTVAVGGTMLNGVPVMRININVTHTAVADINITLTAYRTNY